MIQNLPTWVEHLEELRPELQKLVVSEMEHTLKAQQKENAPQSTQKGDNEKDDKDIN